jgi:gliding motility-associated lipoprotein GldH
MLTACNDKTVYHDYEQTPASGWEKNDPLSLTLPPIQETGNYKEEVGMRINGSFPFLSLSLIVEQTKLNTGEKQCDTLVCELINKRGYPQGKGVSQYQYLFPLKTLQLNKGDSLYIEIRHDMKREILPGITDVGLKVSKTSRANKVAARIKAQKDKQ